MSTKGEEVFLIVKHVKHKKVDGSLYVMNTRIAWMPTQKDTFSLSYNYADIQRQKISPDTKEKVQLQVVTYDGSASTFHFCNSTDKAKQVEVRDQVKELLLQFLPKFKSQVSSALEEKNKILQENTELFQLYKELVVSGVISANEFWDSIAKEKQTKQKGGQEVGVAQSFLSDVKPKSDGANSLKYNLTADVIQSIFKTYPAVKRKHKEQVPGKITEEAFWTQFFQSHYFHRDKLTGDAGDMFADCAKVDSQDLEKEKMQGVADPLLDLQRFLDSAEAEGYGEEAREPSKATTTRELMRSFNYHSTRVLTSAAKRSLQAAQVSNGSTEEPQAGPSQPDTDKPSKKRLLETLELDDLNEEDRSQGPALKITHLERYLVGPTVERGASYTSTEDMIRDGDRVKQQMMQPLASGAACVKRGDPLAVLKELSPGGLLMQAGTTTQLQDVVPGPVAEQLRQLFTALMELLRHYWLCFPPFTPQTEEKAVRMKGHLERFQAAKLLPFKHKLREEHHLHLNLTGHMEDMLQAAFDKFTVWQNKKGMNRR